MIRAEYELSDERLITTEGTIIPQAVRFANGNIFLSYHTSNDACFSPVGAHISRDNGRTWAPRKHPLHRQAAAGVVSADHGLIFDQYCFKAGRGEYVAFYSETGDSGETFSGPKLAHIFVDGVMDEEYAPRPKSDPDSFYEPEVPEFYRPVTEKYGAILGLYLWGAVIRLPDGALGMACHAKMQGNMTRTPRQSSYVAPRRNDGTAPEAEKEVLESSHFLRSEDGGATWHCAGTIGRVRPGRPFDAGQLFSEGFNETGLVCTREGKLHAIMRHGSLMLLWYATSADGGRTWSDIMPMNHPGVAPCMAMMPGGVLAAAWGRPGLTVAFSLDGTGRAWDLLGGVMTAEVQSQNYPWIVPVATDRIMLFYDKRKWDPTKRLFYDHGIYCREAVVRCHD